MAKYEVNEAFLKPLRPGQEFDVDILTLLNDYEKSFDGNIDFTQAAMVVQGSSHIIAKKIDALHKQATEAAFALVEGNEDEGEDNESGEKTKRSRKKRLDLASRLDTLTDADFLDDETVHQMFAKKDGDKELPLLPKRDRFFEDPSGVDRGRELFDVNGDFVAHENDLWVNRVNYAIGRPVTFPGDRAEDTVKAHLEMTMECDPPADHSIHEEFPEPSSSFYDSEMNELINQANIRNQAEANRREEEQVFQQATRVETPVEVPSQVVSNDAKSTDTDDDEAYEEALMDDEWIDAAMQKEWEQIQSGVERVKTQEDIKREQEFMEKRSARLDRWLEKHVKCIDPNDTTPIVYNPKYLPRIDHVGTKKRMDKIMHIVDRNRPMEEQWEEVDKMIWAPYLEKERKERMRKKRKFLQQNARKIKEVWGEDLPKQISKMQKETHCTVEEAAVNILGTSADMHFEDLPPDITNNPANFHEPEYVATYDEDPFPENADWQEQANEQAEPQSTTSSIPTISQKAKVYLERLARGITDSETERKVREWRRSLQPLLEKVDGQKPFDIRETIEKVDQVCPEEPMAWNDLSAKVTTTSYELCRNFAAILQMANEGKVEISPNTSDLGDFTIKRVPDSDREQVAGDQVSALKRARAETASSVEGTTVDSPSIARRSKPKKKQRRK